MTEDEDAEIRPLPLPTPPKNPEPKHTCGGGDTLTCPACS